MSEPTKCPICKTRLKKLHDYKKDDTVGILYNCPKCNKNMVKKTWYGYLTIIDDKNDINTKEANNKDNPIKEQINPIPKTKPILIIRHYS